MLRSGKHLQAGVKRGAWKAEDGGEAQTSLCPELS